MKTCDQCGIGEDFGHSMACPTMTKSVRMTAAEIRRRQIERLTSDDLLQWQKELNRQLNEYMNKWVTPYARTMSGAHYVYPASVPCQHEWKQYEGFTERYSYCAKCDAKEEE